jgi:hypothetical protein
MSLWPLALLMQHTIITFIRVLPVLGRLQKCRKTEILQLLLSGKTQTTMNADTGFHGEKRGKQRCRMYQTYQSDGFPGMESMKNDTSKKCAFEGMPMMHTKMSPVLQLASLSSPVTQI